MASIETQLFTPGAELGVRGLAIMVTPDNCDPSPWSPKKFKPPPDKNSNHEPPSTNAISLSPGQATLSIPLNLQPAGNSLDSPTLVEQAMTSDFCSTFVKSEEMETNSGEDCHLSQNLQEWKDLEKYVIIVKNGDQESGGRKSLKCFLCGKVMERKRMDRMMAHIEAKHFSKAFTHTCDVCQGIFKTRAILLNHIKSYHPELSSAKAILLYQGVASNPNNLPRKSTASEFNMSFGWTNEDCALSVQSEGSQEVADDSHQTPEEWEDLEKYVIVKRDHEGGGRKSFQCSLCGKVMDRSLSLMMAHIEAKHFRELFTHKCDICQDTFKTKAILMSHIKKIHNNQTL